MITKKIMSLFLSIVMIITLFTCKTNTVLANNRSYNLSYGCNQSGQLTDSTVFYKFSLDSYTTLILIMILQENFMTIHKKCLLLVKKIIMII